MNKQQIQDRLDLINIRLNELILILNGRAEVHYKSLTSSLDMFRKEIMFNDWSGVKSEKDFIKRIGNNLIDDLHKYIDEYATLMREEVDLRFELSTR